MIMWSEVVRSYLLIERGEPIRRVTVTRWWWDNGTTTETERMEYVW